MSDTFDVKAVVVVLGIIAVSGSVSIQALAVLQRAIPEELVASTGAAVTGLLGMLAATRTGPSPVTVENESDEPVPVAAADRVQLRRRPQD